MKHAVRQKMLAALAWAVACHALAAPIEPERLRDITAGWEITHEPLLWGFHNLYNPCVVRVPDDDYPFRMWLFGWAAEEGNPGYPGYDAIFCARSKDLKRWEVVLHDGVLHMAFSSVGMEAVRASGFIR